MNQKNEQFFSKHLFLGKELKINEEITIQTPKIRDIIQFGEEKYFKAIHTLTGIPSPTALYCFLRDKNIGYREFSELDFSFFSFMIKHLKPEDTKLLFGDLDLSKYELAQNKDTKEYVLYNQENGAVIHRYQYEIIMDYIHQMHNVERTRKTKTQELDDNIFIKAFSDQISPEMNDKVNEQYQSVFLPLVEQYPAYMELTIFAFYNLLKGGALSG